MSESISRQAAIDAMDELMKPIQERPKSMKIGDRVFVHGYIDEIRKDTVIIRNNGGYFGTIPSEVIIDLPSAEPKTDDENELKFYYVESLDDYWVGRRIDNFYYADWHEGLGFVWSHSKYLPWGEHIVDENTLWKEHTYPSEPIEIPFTEWIVGFVKKYFAEPKTGEWKHLGGDEWLCSNCGHVVCTEGSWEHPLERGKDYCEHCGCRMKGADDDSTL